MATSATANRQRFVLIAMTLANAMILVDQTAVPLALPDVMQTFGVGSAAVQWVLNASLLALAGLLVLGGRLADLFGRRRVFLLGSALFAGASAVAGLAPLFGILLAARVVQGMGGALMLPATVAILSSAYPRETRGRALGTMGGVAAVAGALGPTIGGALTSLFSWRAVLLINLPLLVLTLFFTLRSVPADPPRKGQAHVDLSGSVLLCVSLVGLVFGLSQSTVWGFTSIGVIGPVLVSVIAGVLFVRRERRAHNPLMSLRLLKEKPNYLGATLSQGLAGMAEMGLGLIFPLVLILNLQMDPALAGLALIPTTLPMVVMAPVAGRWYDKSGGRPPLVAGFGLLALSGIALAIGVGHNNFFWLLPGLLIYGTGLAIVLTVNDPVSLDTVPESDQGQASGVSATAEQGGGAVGIALLYALFHTAYILRLDSVIDADASIPDLDSTSSAALRDALMAAEQTGLRPDHFDPTVAIYLDATRSASDFGYTVTFLAVSVLSLIAMVAVAALVRRPPADSPADPPTEDAVDVQDTPVVVVEEPPAERSTGLTDPGP